MRTGRRRDAPASVARLVSSAPPKQLSAVQERRDALTAWISRTGGHARTDGFLSFNSFITTGVEKDGPDSYLPADTQEKWNGQRCWRRRGGGYSEEYPLRACKVSTECHNLRLRRAVFEKKLFEDREVLNELDGVLREDSGNDRQFSVLVDFSFVKFFVL